jgi:hypothetical protein
VSLSVDLAVATATNTSFSKALPGLQLAVDSSSLGVFKTCARKYYYSIVLGAQGKAGNVHLHFGILLHEGREHYDHARASGADHQQALRAAVKHVLKATWSKDLGRPVWPDHYKPTNKSRYTLVRTLIWYLDQYEHDPFQTVLRTNGKPAIELSFSFDSGYASRTTGERFTLCGHIDRVATLNDVPYILDIKTTEYTLGVGFFKKFRPHNQFSLYSLAGQIELPVPTQGLIVDAAQVAVTFSRFERNIIPYDRAAVEEWHQDLGVWLDQLDGCASEQHWPMNDSACDNYGGCEFREICSKSPGSRDIWLSKLPKRVWDPLQRRGDI